MRVSRDFHSPWATAPTDDDRFAAYLAGMAVGLWADEAEVAEAWRPRAIVGPTGRPDRDRWKEAVNRARDWLPGLSSLPFCGLTQLGKVLLDA
ncbi:hypothetical protein B4Q13_21525, partial [Lacticaseibacillus rhamnosus]